MCLCVCVYYMGTQARKKQGSYRVQIKWCGIQREESFPPCRIRGVCRWHLLWRMGTVWAWWASQTKWRCEQWQEEGSYGAFLWNRRRCGSADTAGCVGEEEGMGVLGDWAWERAWGQLMGSIMGLPALQGRYVSETRTCDQACFQEGGLSWETLEPGWLGC